MVEINNVPYAEPSPSPTTQRAKPGFMEGLVKANQEMTEDEIWAAEPFKPDLFSEDTLDV